MGWIIGGCILMLPIALLFVFVIGLIVHGCIVDREFRWASIVIVGTAVAFATGVLALKYGIKGHL